MDIVEHYVVSRNLQLVLLSDTRYADVSINCICQDSKNSFNCKESLRDDDGRMSDSLAVTCDTYIFLFKTLLF